MSTPAKILVVDDEEDLELLMRQRFRRQVRRGEYELHFARNGREALDVLAEMPEIRLVLSDINMPVMDGLTLLSQLEEIEANISAVVVSAYGDMANIRTAMNRGAFDFVTKPIDFNDLQVTVEKTLRHIQVLEDALASRDRLVALRQELVVASQVQTSVLPAALPVTEHFDVQAEMIPAREIGGDFYDFFSVDEYRMGLVIADVSDKGIPAALFTMVSRALLKAAARNHESPSACLYEVNQLVSQDNDACMFVTLFYAVLDLRDGRLRYCNGGHNPPRLICQGEVQEVPSSDDIALGIFMEHEFHDNELVLGVGDALFLYTDGITEACNASEEEFGEGRLDELLARRADADIPDLIAEVVGAVEEFAGGVAQFDDMTCLALRMNSNKPA
ncbi:MAG: SpoIIE family protein phosphatase [Gammaproteobacteria bacterium]|nr:SpoIIE family protein phosphatase [Gammaproteobacteria bacterium]MDE0441074.1 SpoIIE family protein phosphatase [Gammaproteobacteria bacterium]